MKLACVIEKYIKFKQSIGMSLRSSAALLRAFGHAQGNIEIAEVIPKSVSSFLYGKGPVTRTWLHKFNTLGVFYRFAVSRGYVTASPLPSTQPKVPPPHAPYIYTRDELLRLLEATTLLIDRSRTLPQTTLRLLLVFLYGTGLRLGEALLLTKRDVDLSGSLLTIRRGKFHKSRLVPIGPPLCAHLESYLSRRVRLELPKGEDSAFFATSRGMPIDKRCVQLNFQRLCKLTEIQRSDQIRPQPCLHDLRHTFAVHRLISWYRAGADAQRLLPHLSTYLGHIGIASTQRYLSMTQELLKEANNRFERYALSEVSHVK